jgi:DnaJ-domain-containing protein 1
MATTMLFARSAPVRSEAAQLVNPRRAERFATMSLKCELGTITDLSETGLQIQLAPKRSTEPGSMLRLTVSSPMQKLSVTGQVVWSRKSLFKSSQAGVRFVNTPIQLARALVELAKHGFVDTASLAEPARSSEPSTAAGNNAGAKPHNVRASVQIEDYYAALGISTDAREDHLTAAFRKLARELHPDVNKSPDAEQRFAFVAKAYATLKDPAKRMKYDALRAIASHRKAA